MEMPVGRLRVAGAPWRAFKNGLQTVHLWLGIILAIPIILVGITGSLLLLQQEILRQSAPSVTSSGAPQPLVRMVEAAQAAAPAGMTARSIQIPASAGTSANVQFDNSGRPPRSAVYVDPVSLAIIGTNSSTDRGAFGTFLIQLHAFLLMRPYYGIQVTGVIAGVFVFMSISGLILWWPSKRTWRDAFWIRRGSCGLSFHVDLHHVAGFWGSLVLLIMGLSGLYLNFPESFHATVAAVLPGGSPDTKTAPTFRPAALPLDADKARDAANLAVENAHAVSVQFPTTANLPFVVQMERTDFGPQAPQILVTLNPQTGGVSFIDDPRDYALADKVLNWQYALHFGVGMGWVWKILVFLSGVLPLALAITGVTMWWMRRSRRAVPRAVANPAE